MLTFKKTIHIDQYQVYFNSGWRWSDYPDSFGVGVVTRDFQAEPQVIVDFKTQPNLIPFKIKRPLMTSVGMSLFESVSAIPNNTEVYTEAQAKIFIRGIEAVFSMASLHKTSITKPIGNSTYALRVFGCFDNEGQIDNYVVMLRDLYSKSAADSSFSAECPDFADVWFDFGTKCVLSFDKNYLHRLDAHLRVSFKDMS